MTVRSFTAIMAEVEALREDNASPEVIAAAEDAIRRARMGVPQSAHTKHILEQHAASRQQQNRWGK